VRRTVPPSAELEAQIDRLLAVGVGEDPRAALSQLATLGARLIIQRAVEEEFDAWLGRARYERRPDVEAKRNGFRARRLQTAEGELSVEIPQVREAAAPFVSRLFPRGTKLLRTEPLKALVIGAFVRGLSMRDVESLCEEAGLGSVSKASAARMCKELRERFEQFRRRDLYEIRLVALFLDATFLAVRPSGPKEGVLVAWGFTDAGERVLLSVMLGMRESYEDWQALGRDLIARGLGAPMLIVADGAPGLIKAIEQCWPDADRQHCAVHRVRNLLAKLPRAPARPRPPGLLAGAGRRDQRPRRQAAAARARRRAREKRLQLGGPVPGRRPRRRRRSPALPDKTPPTLAQHQPARTIARRGQTPDQGHGPLPRRRQLPDARVGRPGPADHPRDQRHPVHRAGPPAPQSQPVHRARRRRHRGGDRRLDSHLVGNLSRSEFTAPKRRDRDVGRLSQWTAMKGGPPR
jgi:transposase-like protein